MNLLLICGVLLSGALVEVSLAPDQPLPHLYVGEPLIVELLADENTEAQVHLSIRSSVGDAVETYDLGAIALSAGQSRWCVLNSVAEKRGYYTVEAEVVSGGDTSSTSAAFCRIDRPIEGALPGYAYSSEDDGAVSGALMHAGLKAVRLEGGTPDASSRIVTAVEADFRVVLTFDGRGAQDFSEAVGRLGDGNCDAIIRWEVAVGDGAGAATISDVLGGSDCRTPWAVVVPDVETFEKLLGDGIGAITREAVLAESSAGPGAVASLRRVAAEAGFESWGVYVLDDGYRSEEGGAGLAVVHEIVMNLAAGAIETGVDARRVCDDRVLGASLAGLRGLAGQYEGEHYVGDLGGLFDDGAGGVRALIFRDAVGWFVALWSEGEHASITLDLAGARAVTQSDAFGNLEFESAGPIDGPLVVSVSEVPTYVRGEGGPLLAMAARQELAALVETFLGEAAFGKYLGEAQSVVARLVADESSRAAFLDVIRLFPALERGWNSGAMPRNVVVPALEQLARISNLLCILEEARGESFLEPLPDTLRRCEEYQSLYLTGLVSDSGADGRGEWLMGEVRRYMDEAIALAGAGRRIEASALGSLAEWRARALEYVTQEGSKRDRVVDTMVDEVEMPVDAVGN